MGCHGTNRSGEYTEQRDKHNAEEEKNFDGDGDGDECRNVETACQRETDDSVGRRVGVPTVGKDGKKKGSEEGWVDVLRPQESGGWSDEGLEEIVGVIEERLGLGGGE